MKGFLYGQTEYNLLKNSIHLNDYINEAMKNSFSFLSITDDNLYGCYKFYQACKNNNIKPIVGLEIKYLDDDNVSSTILAYPKTNFGYKNLLKISTYLNTNNQIIGLEFLKDNCQDINFVLVFNDSIIERYMYTKKYDLLINKLKELDEQFIFYLGYSYTNRLDKLNENQSIVKICKDISIKTIPIHNCRYLYSQDSLIYETLTKIGNYSVTIHDYEDYSFDQNPINNEELESFINGINLDLYNKKTYLPIYPNTKGKSSAEYLQILCYKGLQKRLNGQIKANYQQRLDYELRIINKMGFSDYFLIVWDFILFAKKSKFLVGPGRGSAAASLVAYCLGITDIDPIKYDLLFERFLNPERISMPDIDTDFPDNHRDEVIAYVKNTYGLKHVCSISAYNTFQMKSAIRDLGRIMKISSSRLNEIITLVENTTDFDKLLEEFKQRKEIYNFLYIIKGLDGLPRHISTHAAGIIISSLELDDIIPLRSGINDLYQSQFEATDLEKIGLLKMDFLGIRNLTIIDNVINSIPNFSIDKLRNIPLNDDKTFELLKRADTLGVFQLESTGIRNVLLKLKPNRFDDLVAVIALYRPGPMDNIDEFIARRHGKTYTYLHPSLEPILKNTYGIIVYQEQIMLIAQTFAGFSLGEADLLRRAVSKKNLDKLGELQNTFIKRSVEKGYDLKIAQSIYQYILKFANYGFNKAHSVAYSILAYQMAYLKANYFNIFMSKILNNVVGSSQTMISYINYAKVHGLKTNKPNINISTNIFEVTPVGMFMPLQSIHSIGESITLQIVEERNKNGAFKSFYDFKTRVNVSTANIEALIYAGAFDCFGLTKKQLIEKKDKESEIISRYLDEQIIDSSEFDFDYLHQKELEFLGFNITYNVFKDIDGKYQKLNASYIKKDKDRAIICFEQTREIKTKSGELMLVGTINDNKQIYDFVIFPKEYRVLNFKPQINKLYLISYNFSISKDERTQIVINKMNII